MNLCFSSLFLVAGLFLSSSALSVEECRPLVMPLPTFEPVSLLCSSLYEPHRVLFKTTKSQWIDFIQTSPDHKEFVQDIGISFLLLTLFFSSESNFTCTYHSLPTCEGCLLYTVDSRTNNQLIHIMNITEPKTIAEVKSYQAFYLMAKESTVKHSDLEHAKKQARCLGFTGEPDFIYNPKNCA
uniref:Apolipoprotein M n=1 Tax=Labrus bergylta TaxID=56723 RepID=A0A3Q3GCS9_9LABR